MCTPDGYIYSREAILESLLQQKKSNKRKYAAWEVQQQDELRKACLSNPTVPAYHPCAAVPSPCKRMHAENLGAVHP